jgi:hypothetical protein
MDIDQILMRLADKSAVGGDKSAPTARLHGNGECVHGPTTSIPLEEP